MVRWRIQIWIDLICRHVGIICRTTQLINECQCFSGTWVIIWQCSKQFYTCWDKPVIPRSYRPILTSKSHLTTPEQARQCFTGSRASSIIVLLESHEQSQYSSIKLLRIKKYRPNLLIDFCWEHYQDHFP